MSSKHFKENTFLVLILLVQIFASTNALDLPQHLKTQAKKLHERCQKQTGVAEELIKQGHGGNIPDNDALKCYIHCLFNLVGLIDESQIIHLENIKEILSEEFHPIIQNLVDKCGTQKGVDGCDTAYQTMKCYFQADLKTLQVVMDFLFA